MQIKIKYTSNRKKLHINYNFYPYFNGRSHIFHYDNFILFYYESIFNKKYNFDYELFF